MKPRVWKAFWGFVLLALSLPFLLSFLGVCAEGAEIRIAWDPNTEEDLAGYRIYYGTASKNYFNVITIGLETTYTLTDLVPGQLYCIAVTAFDLARNESDFSNEVCGVAPDSLLGKWEVEIFGEDLGGGVLWFEEHTKALGGYGLSATMGLFGLKGRYILQPDGKVEGVLVFYDLRKGEDLYIGSLTMDGAMRLGEGRITLRAYPPGEQSPLLKIKGRISPQEIVVAEDWTAKLSGPRRGRLKSLKIKPFELEGRVYSQLFRIIAEGDWKAEIPFLIEGLFFLSTRDQVFGLWEGTGFKSSRGTLRGKFDPSSGTMKFSIKGEQGDTYVLKGQAVTP